MMTRADSNTLRVIFFGDSICVGQGVSMYRGWVTRVAGRLEDLANKTGKEIIVANASVNGNTTRQALERIGYEVQSQGVDILIVQFGMNDCNFWETDRGLPRVSPDAFAANLKEIVDRGIKFGAKTIFLHNNHPTTRDDQKIPFANTTYQASNRNYNALVREIAADLPANVVFTDIEAGFYDFVRQNNAELDEFLLADGLHLSRAGHDIYFDLVSDKIVKAVRKSVV